MKSGEEQYDNFHKLIFLSFVFFSEFALMLNKITTLLVQRKSEKPVAIIC
jgi:hypothetical protein